MSAQRAKITWGHGRRRSGGDWSGMKAFLGLAVFAITLPVQAQQPPEVHPAISALAAASDKDTEYAFHVRDGSRYAVAASRLALQRSGNRAIRSYANMMINDHSRSIAEFATTAGAQGRAASDPDLSEPKSQMLETLQMSRGGAFDQAYVRGQIALHEEAVALHRTYAAGVAAGPLRELARKASAMAELHLARARALRSGSR